MLKSSLLAAAIAFVGTAFPLPGSGQDREKEKAKAEEVYKRMVKLLPPKIKEDPKDDKIRSLQIQRHNKLVESLDLQVRRITTGIWRAESEMTTLFETHKAILDILEVLSDDRQPRILALEQSVTFSKSIEEQINQRADLDYVTLPAMMAVHRLDMEIRLEKAKQAAKK
jgi:hypothetical protein